ncbi:MAG: sporulation initiation factor Spo0A C-terminal domain-containing protein [Bacilli bacterium]|nr:sporulation initiation factor Spo0A C-terminal domain-containing protein [Bacilli bacterium]
MVNRIKKDNNYIIIISSCDIKSLKEMVVSKDFNKILKNSIENINVENYIYKLLHSIGMPSNMKGYKYIKEILLFLYHNDVECKICDMYDYLSIKHKTKQSNVERDIANCIQICFNRGDINIIDNIFGYSVDSIRGNPTNKEFICTLYDKLNMDFKKY